MTKAVIYHNPRCSKSRQTLALLEDNSIDFDTVLYLDTPPTIAELTSILRKLKITARELLRKGEEEYKQLQLADPAKTDAELIAAMVAHPKLIERPIVIIGNRAVLGRPPENVLELIK